MIVGYLIADVFLPWLSLVWWQSASRTFNMGLDAQGGLICSVESLCSRIVWIEYPEVSFEPYHSQYTSLYDRPYLGCMFPFPDCINTPLPDKAYIHPTFSLSAVFHGLLNTDPFFRIIAVPKQMFGCFYCIRAVLADCLR